MKRLLAAIKCKIRAIIRRILAEFLQFLLRHPWLYVTPYRLFRKYCPELYQWLISLLRRSQLLGMSPKMTRVRGNQEHELSPLGQKILADLEVIVPIDQGKK
jgi:hypothetical protein